MATDPNTVNQDLVTNPGTDIPRPVETIQLPPSEVRQDDFNPSNGSGPANADALFAGEEQEEKNSDPLFSDPDPFTGIATAPGATADQRPVATSVLALAMSDPALPLDYALNDESLRIAREMIDSQQERLARDGIANQRLRDRALYLDRIIGRQQNEYRDPMTQETRDLVQRAYETSLVRDLETDSLIAAEQEAVERIQAAKADGDYVEAFIHTDLFQNGDAYDRVMEAAERDLVIAQFVEGLEAQYDDSSWVRGFVNGFLRLIPLKDNFDYSGITDDAGISDGTSFFDWLLRGDNITEQRRVLLDMPVEDLARALAPGGPIRQALESNAGLIFNDPTMQLEIGSRLTQGISGDQRFAENLFSVVDVASAIPVFTATRILKGLGARNAAVSNLARAIQTGNPADARRLTGETVDSIGDELFSKIFTEGNTGGVALGEDIKRALEIIREMERVMPQAIASQRFTSAQEVLDMVTNEQARLQRIFGPSIKDMRVIEEDIRTGVTAPWGGELAADGQRVYRLEVVVGRRDGRGGYTTERAARNNTVNTLGWEPGAVRTFQEDKSGQWFGSVELSMAEEGFATAPLQGAKNTTYSYFRSASAIADRHATGKALVGENAANIFTSVATRVTREALKGMPRRDRHVVTEILKEGQQKPKWYTRDELAERYARQTDGGILPDKVVEAYDQFRKLSDWAWHLRNRNVFLEKHSRGYQSVRFSAANQEFDVDAIINYSPTNAPRTDLFDVVNNRILNKGWMNKPGRMKQLREEGYIFVRTDTPVRLPSGEHVQHFAMKTSNIEVRPLRRIQLNYSPGGSRAYTARWFAKQAVEDASGRLLNPMVFIAGSNRNEMNAWTRAMNEALEMFTTNLGVNGVDLGKLEEVLSRVPGAPSADELSRLIAQGKINPKHRIEVVEDRKMPSQYTTSNEDALAFVDFEETSVQAYERSMGRMYYSRKGEHLRDYTGDFADTINPWESLNTSLAEVSRITSFSGYKENLLRRFRDNHLGHLEGVTSNSSLYDFVRAPIRSSLADSDLAGQIKNNQAAIQRVLRFETGFEKGIRQTTNNMADWALGGGRKGSIRENAHDSMHWIAQQKPINFIRSLAFDANLGFWNIGQLLIQTSTMASALALYGSRHAFDGVLPLTRWQFDGIFPLTRWQMVKWDPKVLDALVDNPKIWEKGFESAEDFRGFAQAFRDSGVAEVGGRSFAMLDEYGASRVFGAASTFDAVREKGRMFFYQAEIFNRMTAATIAWRNLREAGVKVGTARHSEEFLRMTDLYSFQMMGASMAGFQRGAMSIPTQFWAYSFRTMEALLGDQFTTAQKARLLLMNAGMAGTAGVPAGFLIEAMLEEYNGAPTTIDTASGWIERGLLDGFAYILTGADVRIGDKVGTADLVPNAIKDMLGMGEYGDKTFVQIALGATGSKVGTALPILGDALYYSALSAAGAETGLIAQDSWIALARELQTVNFAHNAAIAALYGSYVSKSGTTIASDLPEADAFFFALGFVPAEQDELSYYFDNIGTEDIDDYVRLINNWRQEAFTNRDTLKENAQKEAALLELMPLADRERIYRRLRTVEDRSTVDAIARQWEEQRTREEWLEVMNTHMENNRVQGNNN